MKAIVQDRYGPPDVLELRDVDKPGVGDDDVLIRVHAAGVDPSVWHLMAGLPYLVRLFGYGVRAPKPTHRVRGMDVAGHVDTVGRAVTRFQAGDEVFGTCQGAFAEYARAPQSQLAAKPANVSFEQAAAVPTGGVTALQALRDRGEIQAGHRVLIVGASGGVGSLAVQLAKTFGAHVTGVCSSAKTDLVRSLGADDVIDYTREEFADGARRYDLILDTAGNRPLSQLRRALAPAGTLVLVGGERTTGRWFGGFDRQLRAVALSPFVGQRLRMLVAVPRTGDLEQLRRLMATGELSPVVDRTYPLVETPDAIRYLHQGHARGRPVIIV